MNTEDAVEYLLAGASAVQVGTANFIHPTAMVTTIEGVKQFCERRDLSKVADLVGAVDIEEFDEGELDWVDPTS